ncbi:MAG: methionine adenosyltransferase [Victivallales bacterium]|nr:methionine adenosyltransferase [Victivallales bacterium]
MKNQRVFTSESVSEGHPDKVCDQISDAILDAILMQDAESHVACETLASTNFLVIAGEISSNARVDYKAIAKRVIDRIGYNVPGLGFSAQDVEIELRVNTQSPDIALGVNKATDVLDDQGAGDQGLMFGYACNETPALMPAPIYYAHKLVETMAALRHQGKADFLRPDAKSQVSIRYDENGVPAALTNLVIAHQHTPGTEKKVEDFVREVVPQVIPANLLKDFDLNGKDCHINGTGTFVVGGPNGDCGLTGRKIIVDTYGGMGRHGGGAFSGKDPSKVDRSACYMARYVAKNIVAAGLAQRCEIQVAYGIGLATPLSFLVDTFGTGKVDDAELTAMLAEGKLFDFRPRAIIERLGLKHPGNGWCYEKAASYGHFGRDIFPWEKTDMAAELKKHFA